MSKFSLNHLYTNEKGCDVTHTESRTRTHTQVESIDS